MKLNDIFMQGRLKYVVIGFDGQGRPIATCDAETVAAAEAAEAAEEEPVEEEPVGKKKKTKT